ncbi:MULTISPECIES: glutaredoxin domain-containing protein [Streptomyces]|uniref:glutaredoxin domain-containing protein n=1 Tax=Streptomyces TaxID=1883 RepID=UPI0006AE896A|nr:glutaredoxin domain-containing protein [Streptomyces sp. NRRL F-4707]KOX35996.1 membrane protein [Streptomyces sp. NRRL F-4707]
MRRAWTGPVLLLIAGAGAATGPFVQGRAGTGTLLLVVFALLAGLTSPLAFPRSTGALEAQRRSAADGRPVVFWRPGCAYCMRLRIRLGRKARRLHWVDIWRDEAGAELVREANGGDETVPTLLVAGRAYTNPDPAWVREQVSSPR